MNGFEAQTVQKQKQERDMQQQILKEISSLVGGFNLTAAESSPVETIFWNKSFHFNMLQFLGYGFKRLGIKPVPSGYLT